MTESKLDLVTAQLRQEEDRLAEQFADLQSQAKAVESDLKRIRAASAALNKKPVSNDKQTRRAPKMPAPSRADVTSAVEQLLVTHGPQPEAALRRHVAECMTRYGRSRMGLALRLREALTDGRFELTDDGYAMVKPTGDGVATSAPSNETTSEPKLRSSQKPSARA